MSQLNSEPRPSPVNMSPLKSLEAANPEPADILASVLGIEKISYKRLNLQMDVINQDRKERELKPLI